MTTRKKTSAGKKATRGKMPGRREDFGAPIDGYFAKQSPHLREILETLRTLVEEAAPDASAALKWACRSTPSAAEMMCALAAFKSHVNLILAGPAGTFRDPDGLLEGEGKTGRHLKLRAAADLPRDVVRGWLRAAAEVARTKAARS